MRTRFRIRYEKDCCRAQMDFYRLRDAAAVIARLAPLGYACSLYRVDGETASPLPVLCRVW